MPSQNPGWADAMSSNPRLPREEVLYQDERTARAGKSAMCRLKQKELLWIKDLVQKFSTSGEVAIDSCADMCSTAIACMFLDQCRTAVVCNVNPRLFATLERDLVLGFAAQVLSPRSHGSGSGDVQPPQRSSKTIERHFSQQKDQCVETTTWAGSYVSTAEPYSAVHLDYV